MAFSYEKRSFNWYSCPRAIPHEHYIIKVKPALPDIVTPSTKPITALKRITKEKSKERGMLGISGEEM